MPKKDRDPERHKTKKLRRSSCRAPSREKALEEVVRIPFSTLNLFHPEVYEKGGRFETKEARVVAAQSHTMGKMVRGSKTKEVSKWPSWSVPC